MYFSNLIIIKTYGKTVFLFDEAIYHAVSQVFNVGIDIEFPFSMAERFFFYGYYSYFKHIV